ncbi:MAG: PTS sugar transporter subunit IIA [Syntrophales bacterium]|nr:PTS sugar transporter subunit IIA [Syntrophales bacterium]
MIGILITTHAGLGSELIKAAEMIKGEMPRTMHISIDQTSSMEEIKSEISAAIKKLDTGQGVLILTDLFGGTPANVSLSFMKEGKVEVITGVNLPMLLKISEGRDRMPLKEFARFIRDYGIKNIHVASDILEKKIG